ncbi:lysine-rich arabinogalactan protein 19-like [Zea mays]|uniref:Uncharacterized protein n=1 Tax=Zea mays TaxID=4577 RepID=A0A804N2A5_MAIZE|nr:lysine-rich arabinogalactan protein 19-like [Zea mays]
MPPPRKIRHASVSASPPCSRLTRRPTRRKTAMPPPRLALRADPQPPDPPGPASPSPRRSNNQAEEMHPQMWKLRAATRTAMQPPRTICHAPASHDPPCLRLGFSSVQPPDPSGPRLSFPSALKQPIRENAPTNLEAAAMAPDLAMAFMIWKPHNLRCRFGKHDLGTAITTTIPQMSRPPTTS